MIFNMISWKTVLLSLFIIFFSKVSFNQASNLVYPNNLCVGDLFKPISVCYKNQVQYCGAFSGCTYTGANTSFKTVLVANGLNPSPVSIQNNSSNGNISEWCSELVFNSTGTYIFDVSLVNIGNAGGACQCSDTANLGSITINIDSNNNCFYNEYSDTICNMIKNGGFENYTTCPVWGINNSGYLTNWLGSGIYMNYTCSNSHIGRYRSLGHSETWYPQFPKMPLPSGSGFVGSGFDHIFKYWLNIGQDIRLCDAQKYRFSFYTYNNVPLAGGSNASQSNLGIYTGNGAMPIIFNPNAPGFTKMLEIDVADFDAYSNWTKFNYDFVNVGNTSRFLFQNVDNMVPPYLYFDNLHLQPVDTVIFNTQLIANRCDSANMILNIPGCYGPYDLDVVVNNDTLKYLQVQDGHTVKVPLSQNAVIKVLSITNNLGCVTVLNTSDTLVIDNPGDANFISDDFCSGQSNTIIFLGDTGVFSLINNTSAAIIDPNTGIISGAVGNNTYIIQHAVCLDTVYDTINSVLVSAAFSSSDICAGGTNTVSITGSNGGVFSLLPPLLGATIDTNSGIISGGIPGNSYTIKYKLDGLCPDSSLQTIQVSAIEDPSFTATDFCVNSQNTINITGTPNGIFTFDPVPTDGAQIDSISGIISNPSVGSVYSIKYVTPGVCKDSSTELVNVLDIPMAVLSGGNGDLCMDDSVALIISLTGVAPFTIGIREGNNLPHYFTTISTAIDSLWVDSIGSYSLFSVQDANGCFNTPDSNIVNIKGDSIMIFADIDSGCVPLKTVFTSNAMGISGDCLWNIGGIGISSCDTIHHVFNTPGTKGVSLSVSSSKCSGFYNAPDIIYVADTPVANFYFTPEKPTIVNNRITLVNTSVDNRTNLWFVNNNLSSSVENSVLSIPGIVGEHQLCLQVENQYECWDTTCQVINVFNESLIYIPNAFNPNGDGLNEEFIPIVSNVQLYQLQIFNRWGQLIFETNDENEGWDGTYEGGKCLPGVYIYKLSYRYNGNYDDHFMHGHFTLLR